MEKCETYCDANYAQPGFLDIPGFSDQGSDFTLGEGDGWYMLDISSPQLCELTNPMQSWTWQAQVGCYINKQLLFETRMNL